MKFTHEFRDPIYNFIKVSSDERKVIDSYPFQRLRYIHQLALTYLVYPGATHKRFEHSLGVMELATRIYDTITRKENIINGIREAVPEIYNDEKVSYWRRVIRIAALCHDMGHLPFSHAAEKELLSSGETHESFTVKIIESLVNLWNDELDTPLRCNDIKKVAVGPKKLPDMEFSTWEIILSEIITGDCFGADRIDYLIRDSYHTGVAYGKFDYFRLIDTLRILPKKHIGSDEPALGIELGGIHAAEALLLARYFMFSQVYFHHVRRIYDIHLKEFMKYWLNEMEKGRDYIKDVDTLLSITDNDVLAEIQKLSNDNDNAARIMNRKHYKKLYEKDPNDQKAHPEPGKVIFEAVKKEFGEENVYHDLYTQKASLNDFPVLYDNGDIKSSILCSEILGKIPIAKVDYVFINPKLKEKADKWLKENKEKILKNEEVN